MPHTSRFLPFAMIMVCLSCLGLMIPIRVSATTAQDTGQWSDSSGSMGHEGVHLALLPGSPYYHSRIVAYGTSHNEQDMQGSLWGWKWNASAGCSVFPADSSVFVRLPFKTIGVVNVFCGGASTLSTGELLVSGGHDFTSFVGLRQTYLFRAYADTAGQWVPKGDMAYGRWYPSNVTLADGVSALSFAGDRFFHAVVFGGTELPQDSISATHSDINRLGCNQPGQWMPSVTRPANSAWPEAREGHAAVYNAKSDSIYVFGGRDSIGLPLNNTWSLKVKGTSTGYAYEWQPVIASSPPSARVRSTMVVDTSGAMIVFGGKLQSGAPQSDAYRLRKVSNQWQWSQLILGPGGPGARFGHAAVMDTLKGRNRMLVFGGQTGGGLADNDVYALSVDSGTWTKLSITGKPEAREGHTLVVDPKLRSRATGNREQRYVLYGGKAQGGVLKNDIWALWVDTTGVAFWQQRPTPTTGPAPRTRQAAIWDPTGYHPPVYDRIVMFGGERSGTTAASDSAWGLTLPGDGTAGATWTVLAEHPSFGLAGHSATASPLNLRAVDPERYNPGSGQWTAENAPFNQQTYPYMFLAPSGNLFSAGPELQSLFYRPGQSTPWTSSSTSTFKGGSAVMYGPGEIMKCGSDETELNDGVPSLGTTGQDHAL